ncbi:MAG: hydantoinase/oxoprolinase family protein [Pseudomonadota bacterium]
MAILLGIDTGGTYTDAVLIDDDAPAPGISAKAKALTTRHDLSIGIGGAVDAVLADGQAADAIGLVSISTTLATNALVEGQGGRILLVLIGFEEAALDRAGLGEALGSDPVTFVAGGHTPSGARQAPLDREALRDALSSHGHAVDGIAIVAYFGTRDPEDEIAAREVAREITGLPVTCGHELASALNGPKRALTAVLNARLIGMISGLIVATEAILKDRGITAPLMLVRGDGSLVSADFARSRPIETILSGPAASLIGASHLTGLTDAVVSDIGGTTTDIAILRDGRPALSAEGATVGGHNTMIEAVAMKTHGLGGDSEVAVDDASLSPRLHLGPRRVIPVSLLAMEHPDIVHASLDQQARTPLPSPHDARFVLRAVGVRNDGGLKPNEQALLAALTEEPQPAQSVLKSRTHLAALKKLVGRGLARIAGFTPSDASHVLGLHEGWDAEAARKAGTLLARRRTAGGVAVTADAEGISRLVIETLIARSAAVLLDATLDHDGLGRGADSSNPLAQAALAGHRGAARVDVGLALPLVGLGASAGLYYPHIAERLGTESVVPHGADVANAVGAVVGNVRITREATLTQPEEGRFRVHLSGGAEDLGSEEAAKAHVFATLREAATTAARQAGAGEVELAEEWDVRTATVEGKPMFIEGVARVSATGRPRLG